MSIDRDPEDSQGAHWVDTYASKIVREKGDKPVYVCASGITPSGTVHIGNFREIISVELIVRALREMGKKVRFIYSWDDYDAFRKVPKNMPQPEMLARHLRWPITLVPDPFGQEASYARHHEVEIEKELHRVGIFPEYIYQAGRYRAGLYAGQMKTALEKKDEIRAILDEHRTDPLEADWWPLSVFCNKCNKDRTKLLGWDGAWGVEYSCASCDNRETIDLRTTPAAKLPWRVDWPMRWAHEQVDFEPAGKDHHSEGGSFDTARNVSRRIFGWDPPVTFQYDFIGIKGRGGKISSSSGEVIDLNDVLEVYTPEITRYLFAGTRPNAEFVISFDLDVIKIYEDYDRCERIYWGLEEADEKRRAREKRIYELSQAGPLPVEPPHHIPFRHLCNLLQINSGDIPAAMAGLPGLSTAQRDRLAVRAGCAWNWISRFAPEDFRFALRAPTDEPVQLPEKALAALRGLRGVLGTSFEKMDEKTLGEAVYDACGKAGIEPKEFFPWIYRVLVGKERGPRLANFILTAGWDRIAPLLERY